MARAAIKRLMGEYQALTREEDRIGDVFARPLDDNIFEWHFTILGPARYNTPTQSTKTAASTTATGTPTRATGSPVSSTCATHQQEEKKDDDDEADATPYKHGIYHGRLIFPRTYPLEPPDIVFLTPNGRFVTGEKICSSISSFHKESWRPSYDIRFTLLSLRMFMAQEDEQGVGAIPRQVLTNTVKVQLAHESWNFVCPACQAHDAAAAEDVTSPVSETRTHTETDDSLNGRATTGRRGGWTVRDLYEREMKPYREAGSQDGKASTSDSAQADGPPTEASEAANDATPAPPLARKRAEGAEGAVDEAAAVAGAAALPLPAPQEAVAIRLHDMVVMVPVSVLWCVFAVCGGLVALILLRRAVFS